MGNKFDGAPYTQLTTPARGDVQGVIKDVSESLPENQTKFALLEDLLKFGSWASKVRTVTASGTVTLADTDPIFIEIDPNGADRDVPFPAKSDNNHGYFVRHVGSANVLTLKRSGGAEITTLEAGEAKYIMPSTISDFASLAGSSSSGGGGLTVVVASVTGSNVTVTEDTHFILNLSGLTGDRDFPLPTPSAIGKKVKMTVSVGDDTYHLLLKVNGVEVERAFITNETIEFTSYGTGAGDWAISQNNLVKQHGMMERQTAQSINNATPVKVQLATAVINAGNVCDTTNYKIVVRRSKNYEISLFGSLGGVFEDQEFLEIEAYVNGVLKKFYASHTSTPSTNRYQSPSLTFKIPLNAGDYVELYMYHTEGAAQNTDTTYYPQLAVLEV